VKVPVVELAGSLSLAIHNGFVLRIILSHLLHVPFGMFLMVAGVPSPPAARDLLLSTNASMTPRRSYSEDWHQFNARPSVISRRFFQACCDAARMSRNRLGLKGMAVVIEKPIGAQLLVPER
jgi:hypothetical protein